MKTIFEKSSKTPGVYIDENKHMVLIEGRLIPENPQEFFTGFNSFIENSYSQFGVRCLKFDFEYFNTGAARGLYKFFMGLRNRSDINIIWAYQEDDEDIFESGKEFQSLTELDFNYEMK